MSGGEGQWHQRWCRFTGWFFWFGTLVSWRCASVLCFVGRECVCGDGGVHACVRACVRVCLGCSLWGKSTKSVPLHTTAGFCPRHTRYPSSVHRPHTQVIPTVKFRGCSPPLMWEVAVQVRGGGCGSPSAIHQWCTASGHVGQGLLVFCVRVAFVVSLLTPPPLV